MAQYYSRVTYNQGDSTIFTIPFDYIKDRHIKVYIDDTELEEGNSGYVFLNSTQIQIKTNIPSGSTITIKRETPIDEKIVTYRDTSMVLNDKNLNLSQDQLLNAVQEIYDDNEIFKDNLSEQQDEFEEAITTQQNNFETNLTDDVNSFKSTELQARVTFESNLTTRQNNYETNLTNEFNILKRGVTTYVHTQAVASDTWDIQHDLNKYPTPTCIYDSGAVFRAAYEYPLLEDGVTPDPNRIIIRMNGRTTGKCFLN